MPTSNEAAHANWEPSDSGERMVDGVDYGWQMRDHKERYRFCQTYCRDKRVLDVATGTGYGADILREQGAREVVAVDRSRDALAYAAKRYGTDKIRWVEGNAYALPFDAEFDVVVSFETIEHLKEPGRFAAECRRAVKPDGLYIVSTPLNTGGPFVSVHHELEFNPTEFKELLGQHFSHIEMFGQRRELELKLSPLGRIPDWYRETKLVHGKGNLALFKVLDRLNKAPNYIMAWASGYGESVRSQIRPLQDPIAMTPMLKPNYYVMIAICRP
jgi:ubiquinone/menaquinone biosynthesis C-methylase UbiE